MIDNLYLVVILAFVALMIVIMAMLQTPLNNVVQGIEGDNVAINEVKAQSQRFEDTKYDFYDWIYLLVMVMMIISLWVSVWFIETHPIFLL